MAQARRARDSWPGDARAATRLPCRDRRRRARQSRRADARTSVRPCAVSSRRALSDARITAARSFAAPRALAPRQVLAARQMPAQLPPRGSAEVSARGGRAVPLAARYDTRRTRDARRGRSRNGHAPARAQARETALTPARHHHYPGCAAAHVLLWRRPDAPETRDARTPRRHVRLFQTNDTRTPRARPPAHPHASQAAPQTQTHTATQPRTTTAPAKTHPGTRPTARARVTSLHPSAVAPPRNSRRADPPQTVRAADCARTGAARAGMRAA